MVSNTLYIFAGYISETMKMGASLPAYQTFTLDELKEATDCFDASSFLCDGSHGQVSISNFIGSIGLKLKD